MIGRNKSGRSWIAIVDLGSSARCIHLNSSKMRREHNTSVSLRWILALGICALVNAAMPVNLEESVKAETLRSSSTAGKMRKSSSGVDDFRTGSSEEDISDDLILLTRKVMVRQPDVTSSEEMETYTTLEPLDELPIDMGGFVYMIPAKQVQGIIAKYYRHDREVRRAFAYLSSESFTEKRQRLSQLPEVLALTQYLNASGFDLLKLGKSVLNVIIPPASQLVPPTVTPGSGAAQDHTKTPGLHGMVNSVLFVLPQDKILAAFVEKTETDRRFTRLVDSIGAPYFSKILSNLQNSSAFRNVIHDMHSHRIHIARIVDMLKEYFLLASF